MAVDEVNKELVVGAYADARCVANHGAYQIRRAGRAAPNVILLSAQHSTEEEAWSFAATRVRFHEASKGDVEANQLLVVRTFPQAYCATLRGYHQIRRPRNGSDKLAQNLDFVPLSGRYSVAEFAWQEAAKRCSALHVAPGINAASGESRGFVQQHSLPPPVRSRFQSRGEVS
jgi:hypothetical protein